MARHYSSLIITAWFLTVLLVGTGTKANPTENSPSHQRDCRYHKLCSQHHSGHTGLASIFLPEELQYSLEHLATMVAEFNSSLLSYMDKVLAAKFELEQVVPDVAISGRGLRNLYPLMNETYNLTGFASEDEHRVLREGKWLLASVEVHIHLVNDVNSLNTCTELKKKVSNVAISYRWLLGLFSVENVPQPAICDQALFDEAASEINRARFTLIALRDIYRALHKMHSVLSSCQVQPHSTGRHHAKLHCEPPLNSAFYSSPPSDTFLYDHSQILAP